MFMVAPHYHQCHIFWVYPGYKGLHGDCAGNDLHTIEMATFEECAEECDSRSNCLGFGISKSGPCILKAEACDQPVGSCHTDNFCFYNKIQWSGNFSIFHFISYLHMICNYGKLQNHNQKKIV